MFVAYFPVVHFVATDDDDDAGIVMLLTVQCITDYRIVVRMW